MLRSDLNRLLRRAPSVAQVLRLPLALLSVVACACPGNQPDAVFGGQGADVQARQTPLDQAPEEPDTGPCAKAAPASETKLIEDFEDTDNQLFKAFQREGWWYVAVDETSGTVTPTVGEFKATALPEGEATVENRYALYGKADGFNDWGVVWGTTLRWVDDGLQCPFNASKFVGLKFRVKGTGQLHLKIGNPKTVPAEFEGKCKERCWDTHGQRIPLTAQWQPHVVRFDKLQQGGWGSEAAFDPERWINLNFSVDGKNLPVEFWLDDIEFILPGEAVPAELAPPAPTATEPVGTEPVGKEAAAVAPAVVTPAPTAAPTPLPAPSAPTP
jgi:hypothetical protein